MIKYSIVKKVTSKLSEEHLPLSERLLLILHNLCAINPEKAKKTGELASILQVDAGQIDSILGKQESEGYTKSFTDEGGSKRYYLTGTGIIKVCSLFT